MDAIGGNARRDAKLQTEYSFASEFSGWGKTIYQTPLGGLENWATENTRAVAMSDANRCTMGS